MMTPGLLMMMLPSAGRGPLAGCSGLRAVSGFFAGRLRSRGGRHRAMLGPVAQDLQPDAVEGQGEAEDGQRDQHYQVSAGHVCLLRLRAY